MPNTFLNICNYTLTQANRESGKKHLSDVGNVQNVYDIVDVDEYSKVVTDRVHDDWIVDDDGSVSLKNNFR